MRLRFTIRDLLWLVVVVALAAAWWVDSRTSRQQLEAATAEINTLKWQAAVDAQSAATYVERLEARGAADYKEIQRLRALLPATN